MADDSVVYTKVPLANWDCFHGEIDPFLPMSAKTDANGVCPICKRQNLTVVGRRMADDIKIPGPPNWPVCPMCKKMYPPWHKHYCGEGVKNG